MRTEPANANLVNLLFAILNSAVRVLCSDNVSSCALLDTISVLQMSSTLKILCAFKLSSMNHVSAINHVFRSVRIR